MLPGTIWPPRQDFFYREKSGFLPCNGFACFGLRARLFDAHGSILCSGRDIIESHRELIGKNVLDLIRCEICYQYVELPLSIRGAAAKSTCDSERDRRMGLAMDSTQIEVNVQPGKVTT